MNTPLRDDLGHELEIISDYGSLFDWQKKRDEILNLIASKMPEKGTYTTTRTFEVDSKEIIAYMQGYDDGVAEVKSILKGGTDEL